MNGIVKRDGEWHIWQQFSISSPIIYKKIPESLQGIQKHHECGYQWIKLEEHEPEDWETCDELEHYYDAVSSNKDSECDSD
jgi:hypothetical protein